MSASQVNRRPSQQSEELRPDPGGRLAPGSGGGGRQGRLLDRMGAGGSASGLLVKLALLAVVNGLAIYALPRMIEQRAWGSLAAVVLATIAIDVVYLRKDLLPLKYLIPGTIFLLLFQLIPVVMTAYLAFTNYGTGNLLTKSQAIEQIQSQSLVTPEDAVRYEAVPLTNDAGEVALLLTDPDGGQFLGTADGLQEGGDLGDFRELSVEESLRLSDALNELRVPVEEGAIQLTTLRTAVVRVPLLVYDPATDTVTNEQEGTVYRAVEGTFTAEDGTVITPGWRETIGLDNFTRAFTSPQVRGPFFRVFVWTYVFALLSVLTTFALGLALAVAFNDTRMRSRGFYRVLFVIPYALPSFLTALIWGGLLNQEFGAINQLFNSNVAWLTSPTLAKFSILLVNLWLGFPYMFLITTGALQGIPGSTLEAAKVDGATGPQAFRQVTFPLLLVSVAPLLIGSFAFNFNNFNIIYLLTRGGPPIEGAQTPAGHSDILISYTYRLAFEGQGGADFGFAAAISVLIFIMVAAISAYSFRYTRALEEVT
jgi:arabinogalactan oligomer/maltooligosaccharide transport system permease protein